MGSFHNKARSSRARAWALRALLLVALQLCIPSAPASEFSGLATVTSDYIYRGQARSNGDPAVQLGLDFEPDSGLFVGAWASTIDLGSRFGQRDWELDYYAGYHHQFKAPVSATLTVLRYTFPGQTGSHPYDYTEVLISTTFLDHYSIEYGFTDDLNNLNQNSQHWEVHFEHPLADAWVLGATLGRNDLSDAGVSKYYYWDVGASARFSRLVVDVRWFDNEKPEGFAAPQSAGSQLVLSLSFAF
ncbi:MAG: TorF family putative porin [Xanthomonadales bacterium]|nr:TorF family putative porin [Xanthomonadales bacterium]